MVWSLFTHQVRVQAAIRPIPVNPEAPGIYEKGSEP